MLATNRLVARVDPRASADAELSGGTDFLGEASQLGQLYDRFRQEQGADEDHLPRRRRRRRPRQPPGQTPSERPSASGPSPPCSATCSPPPQPAGEIYSINSGNLFKVTPIFDPSGQALRFQFDYAGTTDVREPDGTTNPSLPRVERHTVDDRRAAHQPGTARGLPL